MKSGVNKHLKKNNSSNSEYLLNKTSTAADLLAMFFFSSRCQKDMFSVKGII